jgi:hypothetical protein
MRIVASNAYFYFSSLRLLRFPPDDEFVSLYRECRAHAARFSLTLTPNVDVASAYALCESLVSLRA